MMTDKMDTAIVPVGVIRSVLHQLEDCPKQESEGAPEATIILDEKFAAAAADLQPGDHLIVLTWLDRGNRAELKTRPRDNNHAPLTGIFSTRSPNRPNPIGLHRVQIMSILAPTEFNISAIEVLDGKPVIDIKPAL